MIARRSLLAALFPSLFAGSLTANVSKTEILKLAQAGIDDEHILNYIDVHSPVEPLTAGDLIDLKKQGVSDRVLAAAVARRAGAKSPGTVRAKEDSSPPKRSGAAAATEVRPARIAIPLKGLAAPCCEAPVERALGGIPGVDSVRLRKRDGRYVADLVMKKGKIPTHSDVDKALAAATREMGDRMGTTYEVDGPFPETPSSVDDQGNPEGVRTSTNLPGVAPAVEKGKPTEAHAPADFPGTETAVEGTYVCPMKDGGERATPGPCPVCGMRLHERQFVRSTDPAPAPDPVPPAAPVYECPGCGERFDGPGECCGPLRRVR